MCVTGLHKNQLQTVATLSELVPPMNSNESRRSGDVYASLETRQERTKGLRTLA